jgi:hypothetical protein
MRISTSEVAEMRINHVDQPGSGTRRACITRSPTGHGKLRSATPGKLPLPDLLVGGGPH